jgi:hypothetical protein
MARGFGSTLPIATICGCALAGCGDGGGLVVRTVSEYGGTPIAGVNVQVGDQPWTATGSNGEARFAPVATPYAVRVHQALKFTTLRGVARQNDKVWQLVGQTANPLVLQVDGTLTQIYKARIAGTVAGRSASSQVRVFGLPPSNALLAADGTFQIPAMWWEGSTSSSFVLRAFESDGQQPPEHYSGYAASRVTATDATGFLGPGGNLTGVSLQLGPVAEARVSGQVTRPEALAQGTLRSVTALLFGQYEWLALGEGAPAGQPAAFDYAFPRIDGAAPWLRFLATAGNSLDAAVGWHDRQVGAPSTGLTFDIPAPVSLTDPADGATFGPSTLFRWSAGPAGGKYALDLICDDWREGALTRNIHYRGVETTSTEVALPAIPGVAVPAGTPCTWSIGWIAPSDFAKESRGSWSAGRASIAR